MNEAEERATFKETLGRLVASAGKSLKPAIADPYIAEPDGTIVVQEATTRTQFLDDLLDALGWTRGANGDTAEEVRLRGDTTVFVDYLGTARYLRPEETTPAPLLLVEAKAWGKPYIGSRLTETPLSIDELLIKGVDHVRNGGEAAKSVLRADWHEHLIQISTYVRRLADIDEHKLRRVVLTSGDWLLILHDAHEAFVGAGLGDDQFTFLRLGDYVRRSDQLYFLLSKAHLGREMPEWVTAARAPTFMASDQIATAFLAAQVAHVRHGSGRVGQTPVISVVPHVILVDKIGRQLTVFANDRQSLELTGRNVEEHLVRSRERGQAILASCAEAFGRVLTPSDLAAYPGLPHDWRLGSTLRDPFVADVPSELAEWTVVTGSNGHFLLSEPLVAHCAFHRWDAARGVGHPEGQAAVSMPMVDGPRTLFVDGDRHHCAHAEMLAMRKARCRIAVFEHRLCCQACRFLDTCWPETEKAALPCGSLLDQAELPVTDEF